MQCGMRDVQWEEERRLQISHQWVADEMGEPDGVLMVDESGYRKKGQDSAGVARQYCGALGKVDNCQVGVFAASASRHGDALVDTRLCLPDPWCSEAYAPQRTKCAVRWCPSIAWMKGLGSVVGRLLLKPVAKVRGHTI